MTFFFAYRLVMFLSIFSESTAVNVALGKSGLFCNKIPVSEKLFDGNLTTNEYVMPGGLPAECPRSYLNIKLVKYYSVQYVKIFTGPELNDELDRVEVYYIKELQFEFCADYARRVPPSSEIRINCAYSSQLYAEMQVKLRRAVGFDIAEVEVHSLTAETDDFLLIYRGCFSNITADVFKLDWEACQRKCFAEEHNFAAIKGNSLCVCTDYVAEEFQVDDSYCDIICEVGHRGCGGENSFSVYMIRIALPHYDGCYFVTNDFVNDGQKLENATIGKCLQLCDDKHFAVMMRGEYCICRYTTLPLDYVRPSEERCDITCPGNRKQICGGIIHVSAFTTCKKISIHLKCSDIFHCEIPNTYDMYGNCNGSCESGYFGEMCLERENKYLAELSNVSTTWSMELYKRLIDFWHQHKRLLPILFSIVFILIVCILTCCSKKVQSTSNVKK